ncbi:MAG: type IV secretion system protein, partial [Streptosporangiaceae bacterium]
MLRPRRFPRKTALVLAVLVGLLSVPHADSAVSRAPAAAAVAAARGTSARPIKARTVADVTPAAPSGGLCSVPGIGDIGGLLGFCALGSSGLTGDLNNVCQPSLPEPEPADSGIDSLVRPPATPGKQLATPYNEYGVAGQYWAATNLQCSDMTSLIGNNISGMAFDIAKSIDRVTISIYQAAAGNGILAWLSNVTDRLITGLGNAIYFPYLAVVVIIGAIWLAWQGLIRKRGTATIEGTIWMVVACSAAILLIGRPADFTSLGKDVSDGISQALNVAFAKLPSPGQATCLPVKAGDPQISPASYNYTAGGTVVDQNANELWTVLVCKPWLDGEFGTTVYAAPGSRPTVVNAYGRQLLWAQAIAVNEKPTTGLIQAKQATYAGIASSIQQHDPGVYPLFQGKEWTTRLEVGFAALLAAVLAGVLVLLISITLILLKLSFLLLLIVGPFFLLIGTHPGFGRVVAMRWAEMLVGVLLKQAAVALVLSILLYCYALIMGTSDAVLPWALKILMIALVTVAAFIYRRPFTHLFSAVGYGMIGSRERADADLDRAAASARSRTVTAGTVAVPGVAAYRAARWARRNPGQAAGLALGAATAARTGAAVAAGRAAGGAADTADLAAGRAGETAAAGADGASDGTAAAAAGGAADGSQAVTKAGLAARARAWAGATGDGSGREPPPLNLPSRPAAAGAPARGAAGPGSPGAPTRAAANGAAAAAGTAASRAAAPGAAAGSAAHGGAAPGGAASGAAASARLPGAGGAATAVGGTASGAASGLAGGPAAGSAGGAGGA